MQKRADLVHAARLFASLFILALRLVGSIMGAETSDGCAATLSEGTVRGEKLDTLESLPAGKR